MSAQDPLAQGSMVWPATAPQDPMQPPQAPMAPMPPVAPQVQAPQFDPMTLILAQNLMQPKPSGSRAKDMIARGLTDFMYSLGKGLEASAAYPGGRGSRAGMGAAIAAPAELAQMQQAQQMQKQKIAIDAQQAQTQMRAQKANEDAKQMIPVTNLDGTPILNPDGTAFTLPGASIGQFRASQMKYDFENEKLKQQIANGTKKEADAKATRDQDLMDKNVRFYFDRGVKAIPDDSQLGYHLENQAPAEYSPAFKAKIEADAMNAAYKRAQTELELAKNDPTSPLFKQNQQKVEILRQGMLMKQVEAATGKPLPQTDENRAVSAAMIAELAPQIQQEIEKNRDKLGAIVGKGEDFMLKAGIKDPELRQLQVDLMSLSPFLSQMHAARGTIGIMQMFDKAVARLGEDPENAIASLKANAGIATKVLDEIQAQHPRSIVTGSTQNKAQKAGATGTPKIGDTKTFSNGRTGKWDGKGWVLQP